MRALAAAPYRGFEGARALARMRLNMAVKEQLAKKLQRKRDRKYAKRERERISSARLQAVARGVAWRERLGAMKVHIVVCQRVYRGHRAREKINEEARRKLEGPKVVEMYRKGTVVSGTSLMLTVRRCGLCFKLIGDDLATASAIGYIYQTQVMRLLRKCQPTDEELIKQDEALRRRNMKGWIADATGDEAIERAAELRKQRTEDEDRVARGAKKKLLKGVKRMGVLGALGDAQRKAAAAKPKPAIDPDDPASIKPIRLLMTKDTRIKPWQHERIVELLLSRLALTMPIHAPTTELQRMDVRRALVVDNELGADVRGHSIQVKDGLGRQLADCEGEIVRYFSRKKQQERLMRAMGQID